jgi:hypothetical protein
MGGNALDQTYATKPGRKPAEEYYRIMERVCWRIGNMFPWSHMSAVTAYAKKESFGDGDILIEREGLPVDWVRQLHKTFMPQNMVINRFKGTALSYRWDDEVPAVSPECFSVSLDIQGLQVDLIAVNRNEFHMARTYYAFNDLGNLMGRIAERMGFKYGWNGLWKELRNDKDEPYANILVSRNAAQIFRFLGYDHERFMRGFDTLEDVFEFAASTPYFNRRMYQLESRNHKSRSRDAKRNSYRAFLAWIEHKPELEKYQWTIYQPGEKSPERNAEKLYWAKRAYEVFPGLTEACNKETTKYQNAKRAKELWNGRIVTGVTGLIGLELGKFMTYCRDEYDDFDAWVIQQTPDTIDMVIRKYHAVFKLRSLSNVANQ